MSGFTYLSRACRIVAAETRIDARITEITESGARISLDDPFQVPERFALVFRRNAIPCMVVWRQDRTIGVVFDR